MPLRDRDPAPPSGSEADRYRRQLEAIANNATLALFILDERQHCTYMNPAAEQLTGYTLAEVRGRPLHDVIHHTRPDGSHYPIEECPIDRAFPKEMREKGEDVFIHKDGTFVPVAFTASPIREEGRTVGTIVEVEGIEEDQRQEAERERLIETLEAEQARLAAIIEHAPVGIVIAEAPSGRITRGNAMAEKIFRHPVIYSESVDAHREWEAYHPDGRRVEGPEYPLPRAMASGEIVGPEEFLYRRGDGVMSWVRITGAPIRDGNGDIFAGLAMVEDIDADRKAEAERARLVRELELERQRLRTIFEVAPAFIATVRGPDHVFEMANPPYLQLVGHRDVIGKPVREALPEIVKQGFIDLLDTVYMTGERFIGEEASILLQREPDGAPEERVLNFVYEPLRDVGGSVSGILAHGVDVTDLVRAREAVEEANRAKSDFLATMSHELRTPLNAMIGYAELLEMGVPEEIGAAARGQVERIRLSATHLLQLIEEILTFSRIEAGRERVDIQPVELQDLADEVSAIIEPLATKKGLVFTVEVPDERVALHTDPRKLRQILLNLLGNAVKFTEEGEITVRAAQDGKELVLEVSDTGIGMPPEERERVFEPFWQAETELHRRTSGTGLGLPVTHRLVELLGGTIQVRSEPGKGSTFRIVLPLEPEGAEAETGD
jgi:PAS domain S-box-containing protein